MLGLRTTRTNPNSTKRQHYRQGAIALHTRIAAVRAPARIAKAGSSQDGSATRRTELVYAAESKSLSLLCGSGHGGNQRGTQMCKASPRRIGSLPCLLLACAAAPAATKDVADDAACARRIEARQRARRQAASLPTACARRTRLRRGRRAFGRSVDGPGWRTEGVWCVAARLEMQRRGRAAAAGHEASVVVEPDGRHGRVDAVVPHLHACLRLSMPQDANTIAACVR